MAGSVNKVILVGNLGADPEIRRTQDGRPIANLPRRDLGELARQGHRRAQGKDRVAPRGDLQRGLCKIAEQYLKKGSKVYLEGQLQTRKWQDKAGHEKYSTEVVLQGFNSTLTMLDSRRGGGGGGDDAGESERSIFGSPGPRPRARKPACRGAGGKRDDMDDEDSVLTGGGWIVWMVLGAAFRGRTGPDRGNMTLAPLLNAPHPVHAFAAMAAFAFGVVQLAPRRARSRTARSAGSGSHDGGDGVSAFWIHDRLWGRGARSTCCRSSRWSCCRSACGARAA